MEHRQNNNQLPAAIELLCPAKNLEYGQAAINYGADAVYIGAPRFGARSAVGNTINDIAQLVRYAHKYRAKVYVALNTLLYDDELDDALKIINAVCDADADGLIIQDMGLLELGLPSIPLIASTQTHNYTPQKVKFLQDVGFSRVILARELSLEQIRSIKQETNVELEAFVHGALCVSMSGQCYMSQSITGRSANRGECAQPCRSYYTVKDRDGNILAKDKHVLSLKDLNLGGHIDEMIEAGVTSFKIEGRLKDIEYVKNVTSYYRRQLDVILEGNANYEKASAGKVSVSFQPDLAKSFNRGFTPYFLDGGDGAMASFDTPKSLGASLGQVAQVRNGMFKLAQRKTLANGDGLCFLNKQKKLEGFLVNGVSDDGWVSVNNNKLPVKGRQIYRNLDVAFAKQLQACKAIRKVDLIFVLVFGDEGLVLRAVDDDGVEVRLVANGVFEEAAKPERVWSMIQEQLSKSGDTMFKVVDIQLKGAVPFLPVSMVNQLRRRILESLETQRLASFKPHRRAIIKNELPYLTGELDYKGNILNRNAKLFYIRHGVTNASYGYEMERPIGGARLMTSKYCIKRELNICRGKENGGNPKIPGALVLSNKSGQFSLEFNCKECLMYVVG